MFKIFRKIFIGENTVIEESHECKEDKSCKCTMCLSYEEEQKQKNKINLEKSMFTAEEIHENFFTEVDRLLSEAAIALSTETQHAILIEKYERLDKLGFENSKESVLAKQEMNRIEEAIKVNKKKEELIDTINYFQKQYPYYKFITEESVMKICEKYGLIYGPVKNYIGSVPDENLAQIEKFKIEPEDEAWFYKSHERTSSNKFLTKIEAEKYLEERVRKLPFEIAAPKGDFDTWGMTIEKFKLVENPPQVIDPVVLAPVVHNNKKYYLIVTAWGSEAEDEYVVNPKVY